MTIDVAKDWFGDEKSALTPITTGLLNETFLVENSKGRFVLQKLNPIFAPEVNLDIEALTSHLAQKSILTPRLVRTSSGDLWSLKGRDCWRVLTFIAGDNFNTLQSQTRAFQAGLLVGNFHRALVDFEHDYCFSRVNVHDTKAHLQKLQVALNRHSGHPMADEATPLAEQILNASKSLRDLSTLVKRHSHGDLKINNLVFGATANSLIDLDTIGLMPWPIEMGDAFRSWCNPTGEDAKAVSFDEGLFEAAITAYAQSVSGLWTSDEIESLADAMATIPLELSSRFLRDTLEDCYFGYDASRFESRSAHNFVRAKGQFALYCDIEKKRAAIAKLIRGAFAQDS